MKNVGIALLVLLAMAFTVQAQAQAQDPLLAFKVKAHDQVMVTLLSMVMSDLNMCRATLVQGKLLDNVMSMGHLNNAKSALQRTDLDPAYIPLITEILARISKIKFYIVMNDLQNVQMRLAQLIGVIQVVLGAENPGNIQIPNSYPNNYPNNGGNVLPMPRPELPPNGPQGQPQFNHTNGALVPTNN